MKDLATALATAQGQIKAALKDSTNPHFRSKYADLASVWDACREPLSKNGLSIIQTTDFDEHCVWLVTTLLHKSGEQITGRYPLRPTKEDPQGFGSAITYARRYCVAALVGVVADEDDDGNAASAKNGNGHSRTAEPRDVGNQQAPAKPEDAVKTFLRGNILSLPVPGAKAGKPDWKAFVASLCKAIDACEDFKTLDRLWGDNAKPLAELAVHSVDMRREIEMKADARRDVLAPVATMAAE